MGNKNVRVRFAPSPTGYLHIGGARTAIFNWLYAKKNNGKFLLRIEDTDILRSDNEMIQSILDSLLWLGLKWDEDIIYQSHNIEKHKELVSELLDTKKAYRCFCTKEELNLKKEEAKKEKKPYKYDRTCLKLSEKEITDLTGSGESFAIRFLVPDGVTVFVDMVYGKIEFKNEEIEDFVILRSDGTPTYQLAVVSDDKEMDITHIIRGDDHLSNTPKQTLLYKSLDFSIPVFAHLPLILGSDKKRLSKRHGAVSVLEYRNHGYLPETILNFLSLLGWSPGDDKEILSKDNLIRSFSFDGISKKSAVFDEVKLDWMNSDYIGKMETERLYDLCNNFEREYFSKLEKNKIIEILELVKPRVKRLDQIKENTSFFLSDPSDYNEKSVKKYWRSSTKEYLNITLEELSELDNYEIDEIEKTIRNTAEKLGVSAAKLIHPIRICLTGSHVSPGLFEVMHLLGKKTVIERIQTGITRIQNEQSE